MNAAVLVWHCGKFVRVNVYMFVYEKECMRIYIYVFARVHVFAVLSAPINHRDNGDIGSW